MAKEVPNPWLNISWDNPFADGDRDYSVMRGKFKFGSVDYVNDTIDEYVYRQMVTRNGREVSSSEE